jgi:hypothetical protein
MTTAAPSAALATIQPAFTDAERVALAGFRGLTRGAYALDLRQFASWCRTGRCRCSRCAVPTSKAFARDLEAMGPTRATVTRRLCHQRQRRPRRLLRLAYPPRTPPQPPQPLPARPRPRRLRDTHSKRAAPCVTNAEGSLPCR